MHSTAVDAWGLLSHTGMMTQPLTAVMANTLLLKAGWWEKSGFKGFGLIIWTQVLFLSSVV